MLRTHVSRDGGLNADSFPEDRDGWPIPPRLKDGRLDAMACRLYRFMRAGNARSFYRLFFSILRRRPMDRLPIFGPLPRGPLLSASRRRMAAVVRYGFALRWVHKSRVEGANFGAALGLAERPGYLGNPAVVHELIGPFLLVAAKVANMEAPYTHMMEENLRLSAIFAGLDPAHPPVGDWNGGQGYRDALIVAMNLDAAYCAGEDTTFVASEALAALVNAVRERVTVWRATGGQLRLDDIHQFAAGVFLGTGALGMTETTLADLVGNEG